mgnify:FL=1
MKDTQFISTIKYGIGMVTFPLFYLVQTLIVYFVSNDIYLTLGYLISLPLTGYFAYSFYQLFREIKEKIRINQLFRKNKDTYKRILALKREIIDKVDQWVNQMDITSKH